MNIENLSTLKIHKLTQEQYDRELEAGRIEANALYLTPDTLAEVTKEYVDDSVNALADDIKQTYATKNEINSMESSLGQMAYNADQKAQSALNQVANKQDKITIITDENNTSIVFNMLENYNTDYRIKQYPTNISFEFPSGEYSLDYTAGLSFYTGRTPPTVSYTREKIINWVGTDCSQESDFIDLGNGILTDTTISLFKPVVNTQYDIVFYFNGTSFIGLVNGYSLSSYNR
jgi:hypothetical protein